MKRSTITMIAGVVISTAALLNMQATAPRGASSAAYTKLVQGSISPLKGNSTIAGYRIVAGSDPINGRGLVIASSDAANPISDVLVRDCMIQADGDDGCSVWGYARRIKFINVAFLDVQSGNGAKAKQTKACLLGSANNQPAPDYPTWVSFQQCTFQAFARAPDLRGGIARFDGCVFRPSGRNVWTEAKANVVRCDFWTSDKPADATWWDVGRPICLKDPLPDSIYVDVATCTLNGRPITAAGELFRMLAGGDVDPRVFRSKPW